MQWTEYDTELSVLERLRLSSVVPPQFEEVVAVRLQPLGADYPAGGMVRASAPTNEVMPDSFGHTYTSTIRLQESERQDSQHSNTSRQRHVQKVRALRH